MNCELCKEMLTDLDVVTVHPGQAHRACMLRTVSGGIGHHIAHDYWCVQMGDPDAGLTFRQSALLVDEYINVVGLDQAITQGART